MPAIQSQIVTPDRLIKNKKTHGGSIKVEVTDKNLKEAKALRDEINRAIEENRYYINVDNHQSLTNTDIKVNEKLSEVKNKTTSVPFKPVTKNNETSSIVGASGPDERQNNTKQIEDAIGNILNVQNGTNESNLENKSNLLITELLGDELANTNTETEVVEKNSDGDEFDDALGQQHDRFNIEKSAHSDIKINIVESQLVSENDKQKFLLEDFLPKQYVDREVLTVTSIEEDPRFLFGDGVREWKILRTEDQSYWIGLRSTDFLMISNEKYENATKIKFGYTIENIETFSFWNTTSDHSTGVLLLSISNSIIWLESSNLDMVWQWNIGKKSKIMKFYQIDGREFIAILAVSTNGQHSINIYEFIEETKEFWITQMIPLENATDEMVFLDTGREAILAVTQGDDVLVFDYNPDAEIRYDLAGKFTSRDLSSISAFKMGGNSYLAISGREAKILRYYRGDFVPQTIFGEFFKWVHRYFPIPARTYRDDLILLVQHSMEFEGHSLTVLEALVWNGHSFENTGDIPCTLNNETLNFGATCMIDLERESGIAGAAIIDGGQNISIIVPREDAPSGVFKIHTILNERKTELQELAELYKFLNATVMEQEAILDEAHKLLGNSNNLVELDLDYYSANEILFGGEIDQILINEIEWTGDDENFDIEGLLNELKELSEDVKILEAKFGEPIVGSTKDTKQHEDGVINDCMNQSSRNKRSIESFDFKDLVLDNVIIENLIVDTINNQQISKLIQNNDSLCFNGTIIFGNGLTIKDKIISSEQKSTNARSSFRIDETDTLEVDELRIDGDIDFNTINGVLWTKFLSESNLIYFPAQFGTLRVEGAVIFDQGLEISNLNRIQFPEGYLWSSGPNSNVITARKNFTGTLEANAVDTDGLINGIDPFTLITLSDNQNITGKTIFSKLEVTEELELNGTVSGGGLSEFLANPTLLETNEINAACQFNKLTVLGDVQIFENLNDKNFDNLLDDIVYRNDSNDPIQINSNKTFIKGLEILGDVEITSNKISNIPIDDFLTKDTEQILEISELIGNIEIENLNIEGSYNSINVSDLFKKLVTMNSGEFLNITLIFENPELLNISQLVVHETLNNDSCQMLTNINEEMQFEELKMYDVIAETVQTDVDIDGPGKTLNGLDIRSLNDDIEMTEQYPKEVLIDEMILEDDLDLEFLNGYEVHNAIKILEKVHDIPYMVKQGLITIRELIVNGNITINAINEHHFEQNILSNVIWLDRINHIKNPVLFKDTVILEKNLQIEENFNDEYLQGIINDIVWKECPDYLNCTNILKVQSQKTFTNPIDIENNAEIEILNQGLTKNLATINNSYFHGNVHFLGDVEITNMHVQEYFNDVEAEVFTNLCRFDSELNAYILGGPIHFRGETTIGNLQIIGSFNEIENFTEYMENLIYKNETNITITSEVYFENEVYLRGPAFIEIYNGRNITSSFQDIVYDNEENMIEIHGPVVFRDPVKAESIEIETDLQTSNLGGCDFYEWQMNSISLDEDISIPYAQFAAGSLDGNSLTVSYLNRRDLSQLVTLHTSQNFSGSIHLSELYLIGSLNVSTTINDRFDIKADMENTVMKNRPYQRITSPITAKSLTVLKDLNINTLINEEKNISDVVHLLSSTVELNTPIFFENLTVPEVFTKDIISGFNFNEWYDNSLWSTGRPIQNITGKWEIENLYVKDRIVGNHNVNDIPLDMIRSQLDGPSEDQMKQFKHLADNYNVLCQKTHNIMKKAQNRIYFIKYFVESTEYKENSLINSISSFESNETNYLLTNIDCYTNVYKWDMIQSRFIPVNTFESGSVLEFVPIPNMNGNLRVAVNARSNDLNNCKNQGLNNWIFNSDNESEKGQFYGLYDAIHYDRNNYGIVYGLPMNQNAVIQMNMYDNNIDLNEKWDLPIESQGLYRFLPDNTEFGTALSDGRRILVVNKKFKTQSRRKRGINGAEKYSFTFDVKENKTVDTIKEDFKMILQDMIGNVTNYIININQMGNSTEEKIFVATEDVDSHNITKLLLEIHKTGSLTNFKQYSVILTNTNSTKFNLLQTINLNITKSAWQTFNRINDLVNLFRNDSEISDYLLINQNNGYLETVEIFSKKLSKKLASSILNIKNIIENNTIEVNHMNKTTTSKKDQLKMVLNNLASFLSYRLEFLKSPDYPNSENKSKIIKNISERGIQFNPLNDRNISNQQKQQQQQKINSTNPLFNPKLLAEYFHEPIVGQAIQSGSQNLLIADNVHIPNKISGEVIAVRVSFAENQRILYAVTNRKQTNFGDSAGIDDATSSTVQDSIKIFFDVMQGHVFQTIKANNPRSLAVLNIRDETVLGFIDGNNFIKLYIYRGIQGFVEFALIKTKYNVDKLLSVTLPKQIEGKVSICPDYYFIGAGENYFTLYKAILVGTCSIDGDLECGNWV